MTNLQRAESGARRLNTFVYATVSGTCLLLALLKPTPAHAKAGLAADNPSPEENLVEAQLDYQRANDTPAGQLRAYAALSEIWGAWRQIDPQRIEYALQLAAEDKTKSPGLSAYASKLLAYARLRRGDIQGAQNRFEAQGYVTNWLVVGPFDNEGGAGFDQTFGPEADPQEPIVPGRAFTGKERPVRYRVLPPVFKYGWVDFGQAFRPATHVCGYATTFVKGSGKEDEIRARDITLFAGSNGAHRVLWNGQVALQERAYRGFDTDRRAATVELKPGYNRLTIKACGSDSSALFAVRLGNSRGRPDATLITSTDIVLSESSSSNVEKSATQNLPAHPSSLDGPLSLLERISQNPTASADELEAATKYLILTGGDDPKTHQARDLAQRAVDRNATVERLLMLAGLAEDRNAAADAIRKAEAIAHPDDVTVLLARAEHSRSGPSPQEAFPIYDRILELDPDNVRALQGRVELYNVAGLKHTALATLEAAFQRSPHSVLLANMVASQRGALGLSVLSSETADRYAALRFDDSTLLTDRLELALARRNPSAAQHWLGRIQHSDPHSLWSYQLASRVHRALGDRPRAVLDLEQALDLAPEDVGVLQSLADLRGRMGDREGQLALLQEVLRLRPQEVEVRKYVDHIEPPEAPPDERYAMPAEEFLKKRHGPAAGNPRRTLTDLNVTTVYENGLSSQFRQVVFQPLSDASAATSRQYAFQYQADRQRVQLKGAKVYRADGSVDEAIESGEGAADDPSISMYTSARTYYVQFPRLEPGDVVELRYRLDDVTPRNEFADYFGDVVFMQSDEPIAHAKYVLITPKSRKLNVDAKSPGLSQKVTETDKQRIYSFTAQDVPAISPEQGMPPWAEVLGFVHVSTYSTWNQLGRWYWGLVRDQLDLDQKTRDLLSELVKDKTTTEEKVKAVYAWVTKNTRYVALEFGIYGYKPRRCVQTVSRGWGDCKDKATVIVTFLRELGIDANLVIVRTAMRGDFHSKLPSLAPFDHAIAYVPSMNLYLDGTAEHSGIYELPVMDHNALGLLVLDGKAKLVRLPAPDPTKNVIARTLTATIANNGDARLEVDYSVRGYAAPGFRSRYEAESSRRDRLSADMGQEFPGMELDAERIVTSDLSDGEAPVDIQLRGKVPRFARPEGDSLSIPVSVKHRLTARYAALSTRKQDIDLNGFSTREETVNLRLPGGATIASLPPETTYDGRFGSYSVQVERAGATVTVRSRLSVKVSRVEAKDYDEFRRFCVQADQALARRLVVRP